ncbi:MAG TPA: class D sortase [Terriglobia bacterium]|nr:class D sortase [Terriglobia bacterium]
MSGEDKPERKTAEGAMGIAGRLLLLMGAVLIAAYVVARIHAEVMSRAALREFSQAEQAQQKEPPASTALEAPLSAKQNVDFSLWSMKRITAYEDSLSQHFAPPLAVLEIPKIGVEVPVFDGTDDLTLNRGVGRIIGSGRLGQGGNVGIAGHRDGFFRGLKDVVVGDQIELRTPHRTETYRVDQIRIVAPTDVDVLKDRGIPTLTLVTCYPFYFIGNAPQRYIVRATASGEGLNGSASDPPQAAIGKIKKEEKTP